MEQNTEYMKRSVAFKVKIKELSSSTYHKSETEANYVLINEKSKVSRVNIIGTVLTTERGEGNTMQSFDIDDSTGSIRVRIFDPSTVKGTLELSQGQSIIVIGKPREYAGSIYIVPEVIQLLDSSEWIQKRLKELEEQKLEDLAPSVEKIEAVAVESTTPVSSPDFSPSEKKFEPIAQDVEDEVQESPYKKYLTIIESLDQKDGAPTEDVIAQINEMGDDGEKIVDMLLKEGEVFEIRAGRIKILG